MKKFLRMVVVFALAAGASLAYTSCTKDYDKELQDVNTELSALQSTVSGLQTAISNLEALASTVSSQGGDISGIKATISQLQSAINAIQSDYVTEAEAKAIAQNAVASLKEEVDALKENCVTYDDLFDILSELTNGVLELMAAVELQVVGSVQSISKLPTDWAGAGVDNMDLDRIQAYNLTNGLGTEVAPQSAVILAGFNVTPASAAEELYENANAFARFKVVGLPPAAAALADNYFPAEIYDYNEDGDIFVKVDMSAFFDYWTDLFGVAYNGGYASIILSDSVTIPAEDEDDEDMVLPLTNISTSFFNVRIPAGPTDIFANYALTDGENWLAWGGAAPTLEVPYNEYETSARTFGDGLEIIINGDYTIEEFAALYGFDPAVITPTIEIAKQTPFTTTENVAPGRATATAAFNYDETSHEVSMKATKLADAVKQLDNHADVNINVNFGTQTSNAFTQRYVVVEADGGSAVIEGESFIWKGRGSNVVAPANDVRTYALTDAEALVTPDNIKVPAAGFNFVPGDGPLLSGTPQPIVAVPVAYLANEHVNLATVNYPVGALRHTAAARNVKLSHNYISPAPNYVKTNYTMTVAVGPKPANRTIDLGTFTGMGSASANVNVKLAGIIQQIIDKDAALYANVPVGAAPATLISRFIDDATWTPVTVVDENGIAVGTPADFVVGLAYTAKGEDNSALTITYDANNYTNYGSKYKVTGTIAIWGVTYTVSFNVALDNAAFRLVPTPYVQEGNVIPVEGTIVAGLYKLDDVHLSKYFQIDAELPINDILTVDFAIEYEWDGKTPAGRYAPAGAITPGIASTKGVNINGVAVTAATGQLVDAVASTITWNTYDGRKLFGKAQLKANGNNIGSAISFTIETPNPIKSAVGAEAKLDRFAGVDVVALDMQDSLNIITVLTDKQAKNKFLHRARFADYGILVGGFDPAKGYVAFGAGNDWPTLKGKLNGADFTFTKGVHYTVDATGKITFLADNAYGDIEVNVPLCILHVLDYNHGVYNDPDADGFGLYGLTEGVEIVNFPIKITQK
jgi:hypothetical protein